DVHAEAPLDALVGHLLDAPLDQALLDLEVRHAEAHEPAARLVALEQDDVMADAAQLLRGSHPGRAGADHRDAAAGLDPRRLRADPALVPRAVDDRVLDLLDRDRVALVDLEHARGLARRRAQPPGELREVVRRVELEDRVVPLVAVDEVVPVGDEVAERAAVVAERDAALHAARALRGELVVRATDEELLERPVALDAPGRVVVDDARAVDLQEAAELTHRAPPQRSDPERSARRARRRRSRPCRPTGRR